jgi:hypothetical protein
MLTYAEDLPCDKAYGASVLVTQLTCFSVTKVRILTLQVPEQRNKLTSLPATLGRMTALKTLNIAHNPTLKFLPPELSNASALECIGPQFACFTGTKVQILTFTRVGARVHRCSLYLLYWYKVQIY